MGLPQRRIYAFIDGTNLHRSIKDMGWVLHYGRFRRWLLDKFGATKAFYFIGYVPANRGLYESLRASGYTLRFKPTSVNRDGERKGNIDAELILCAVLRCRECDGIIIVTGDGDYYCLVKYLKRQKKLLKLVIPDRNNYSYLLSRFSRDLVFLNGTKDKLEYRGPKKN
jgi:uncharacterized LabA/DUF88 family protein